MLDRLSIPRRALDFEDYVDIVRRNIRWIIGPAFAGLVISTVVAYLMEDTFVSKALIRIVPQQISEDYVKNTNAQDVSDRINGMAQQILSRGTLTNLINTYGLYKSEIKSEPMEDVIATMREAIAIRPTVGVTNVQQTRSVPAMQIQFSYRNRTLANKVCADIVTRFMNASSEGSLESQTSANQFITDEFDRAKRDLDAANQKLSDYRTKNAGRLPEQLQTNMSEMNALEQRLNSLSDSSTRNSEKRMLLEAALRMAKDRLAAVKGMTPQAQARNDKASQLDHDISDLESTIASMKDRYTDSYPDLQTARDRLAVLKRQRDDALKNAGKGDSTADTPMVTRERMDAQAGVEGIETQIKASTLEEQQINRELQNVNASLRGYQARVESIPAGEKEYSDLLRDSNLARQKYDALEANLNKSRMSMDLERRKQGETLELLESASLPTDPTKPQRVLIVPIGLFGGLLIGALLVALREVRDTSLKNLKDARLYTQLSILGSVPLLENDVVVQRRKQVMWVGWATATIVGLAVAAGSIAHYYINKT
jgi:polysaccharide chain length determinant protein (PEP-CTERM system associated)